MTSLPAQLAGLRAPRRAALLQVAKTAAAVVASWFAAGLLLRVDLPIFAAVAALLIVQPSVSQTLGRALERSLGVLAGVVIAVGITTVLGRQGWLVLLAVVVVLVVAWALRIAPQPANQAGVTALLVLALGATTPAYAVDRIIETLVGAIVAILVNLAIVPPVVLEPARAAVASLGADVAAVLDRLASALVAPEPTDVAALLADARTVRDDSAAARTALDAASESLRLNPRRRTHRSGLREEEDRYARLAPIAIQVVGMVRTLRDNRQALRAEPLEAAIAEECRRAAHDLRRLVDREGSGRAEPPALTTPIRVAAPPEAWPAVGALLEDLRRIRQEIAGDPAELI